MAFCVTIYKRTMVLRAVLYVQTGDVQNDVQNDDVFIFFIPARSKSLSVINDIYTDAVPNY